MTDADDNIGDNKGDLREEHQEIVEQLKEILVEGRTGDVIMFKKVDKKILKVQKGKSQ